VPSSNEQVILQAHRIAEDGTLTDEPIGVSAGGTS
jgi:hypothetical protein